MNDKPLLSRILISIVALGSAAAGYFWWAGLTAKCEGFGCIGVGVLLYIAILLHLAAAIAGGILIWLSKSKNALPKWLVAIETLNVLPILWIVARWLP
ncbi:MAG TPA: hypothetical protein VFF26_08075 [Gallionella sp.]|nr:hypothetical protein [Gallionella sp.]